MNKKQKKSKLIKIVLAICLLVLVFVTLSIMLTNYNRDHLSIPPPNPLNARLSDPGLLYYSSSSYGLCSNEKGSDGACSSSIYLYSSGKLVGETVWEEENQGNNTNSKNEKQLSESSLEKIITQIKKSDLMVKNCPEQLVMDASWSYQINIDGVKKTFRNPSEACQSKFEKIDELINSIVKSKN
jgi:hypothetical protein